MCTIYCKSASLWENGKTMFGILAIMSFSIRPMQSLVSYGGIFPYKICMFDGIIVENLECDAVTINLRTRH